MNWICIITNNPTLKIYKKIDIDVFKKLIDDFFKSKKSSPFLLLNEIFIEYFDGKNLYLTKWQNTDQQFEGILSLNIESIVGLSILRSNSEYVKNLETLLISTDNVKIKIR